MKQNDHLTLLPPQTTTKLWLEIDEFKFHYPVHLIPTRHNCYLDQTPYLQNCVKHKPNLLSAVNIIHIPAILYATVHAHALISSTKYNVHVEKKDSSTKQSYSLGNNKLLIYSTLTTQLFGGRGLKKCKTIKLSNLSM